MELNKLIFLMADNAKRICALAGSVSEERARWKPDHDSWSVLEVINHLFDIEKEDFRVFLDYTLYRPGETRPKIAPLEWVTERAYNERDLEESLKNFITAREASLTWLRSLTPPDWEVIYEAPWGKIRAGDIFAAWVAHDLLHMRQLVRLHWAYTMRLIEPYRTDYAGEW